jgi:bifunctional UDP-N-acetylglucosamine pyrophosphorylase/glucosamine-1-phosphate N-acetyltransferase/UDP-N-acetylglucosamine pyrophosphorylase
MTKPVSIILAAGKGTRMKSDRPKVLAEALGRPLVAHVLDALRRSGVGRKIVVVGYRADLVQEALAAYDDAEFVDQTEQLGTGHAVQVCRDRLLGHDGAVLVVTGDSPLLQIASVTALLAEYDRARPACILGTLHKPDPRGLGRIVRDADGKFLAIVEEKDTTPEQRLVTEVNMSTYVFDCRELVHALNHLRNDNRQREYYLTDCPGFLKSEGKDVRALPVLQPCEALSVNTVDELAIVEAEMRSLGYRCAN